MSDKEDDTKPKSSESSKHSLKSATGKLKAEALRRLQLQDDEYDTENGPENGGSREATDDTLEATAEDQQDGKDGDEKDNGDEEKLQGSGSSAAPDTEETRELEPTDNDGPEKEVAKNNTEMASGENIIGETKVEQAVENEGISGNGDREDESKTSVSEKGGSKAAETGESEGMEKDRAEGTSEKPGDVEGSGHKGAGSGGDNTIPNDTGDVVRDKTGSEVTKDESGAKDTSGGTADRPSSGTSRPGTGSKGSRPGSGKAPVEDTIASSGIADRPSSRTSRPGSGSRRSRPGSGKAPIGDTSSSNTDRPSSKTSRPGTGSRRSRPSSGKAPVGDTSDPSTKDDGKNQDQGDSEDPDKDTKIGSKTDEGPSEQTKRVGDNEGQKESVGVDDAGADGSAGPSADNQGASTATLEGSSTEPKVTKSSATETESKLPASQSKSDDSNVDGKSGEKTLDKEEETSNEISPPMSETVAQNNTTNDTVVQDSSQKESKDEISDSSVKADNEISTDDKSVPKQDNEKKKSAAAESSQDSGNKNDGTSAGDDADAGGKTSGVDSSSGSAEKQGSDSNLKKEQDGTVKSGSGDETEGGPPDSGKEKDGNEKGKDDEDEREKDGKKKKSKKSKKNEKGESVESSEGEKEEEQEQESKENQEDGVPDIQEVEGDEEEDTLPDDFYYDYGAIVSRPYCTEGVPVQLITLHHSFGYECTRRSNLHVMDEETVLFSAGNVVQLLNIKTQEQSYFHTTGGGGIGAIAVHPSRKYFAVAEKGIKPDINIFEYPSLKLHRVLREGTEEAYANLDFSPDGTQLASVGSSPDYMMTIWDWKKEKISLRSKAFAQDIYQVAFSPDNEGHITTGGSGHIRFWTMANTFTGLKLQGMIGKFGAKEISDIEGFVELPDGKVLSSSDWGNMLLWEGGLIKVEICKKGKKTCHQGMIQQFFMDEGELMSIGVDGYVKVWDFESIDTADTEEEGSLFEVDPMYELKVGADVKLMSMQKAVNSEAPIWYAQDASGGIWKLDLSFTHTSHAPERMFSYHAGIIKGMDTSPVAHFVATTGVDHTVRVYDYLSKKQICHSKYNSGGSNLLWVPKMVDAKGTSILAGFADGVVRLLTLNKVDLSQVRSKKSKSNYELTLTQVFKPHTKPVTVLTIDYDGELLATGSDDCTVFFFTIGDTYKPIGFVETASPVVSIVWSSKGKKGKSVLVSCKDGTVLEVEAPEHGEHDTSKTFHLPLQNLKITEFFFKSVKDKLRKAEKDAIKAKEKEEKRKKKEAERARRRERGIEEEEEENEEEEGEQEEEEEEKHDHGPSQIIHGFYYGKTSGKFYLSMDGWDAGYLYECAFDDKPPPPPGTEDSSGEPKRCIPVDNSNDVPIRSVYFTNSKKFLILGMDNGLVRIHPLEPETELEHLSSYWSFSIHDNHNGAITKIKTSFDDKYVFTTGHDGNFFVHKFMDKAVKGLKVPHKVSLPSPKKLIGEDGQEIQKKIDDIDDPNFYSIELEKQKAEHDRMMKLAEEKKQNTRKKIANLRKAFKQLMNRSQELPNHVQLKTEEFVVDPQIKEELKAKTEEKIELVRKELEWESEKQSIGLKKLQKRFKDEVECERIVLRAFLTEHLVSSFRASKPDYLHLLLQEAEDTTTKAQEGQDGGMNKKAAVRQLRRQSTAEKMLPQQQQMQQQAGQGQSQLGGKVAKALEKAEARRIKRMNRQAQWDELNRNKPDENYEDPKDKSAIKEAKENMGDYKLKTAKDYVVPESQRVNAEKKRLQLLKLLDQIHQYKFEFNQKFLALRNKKIAIIKEAKESIIKIEEMQKKIEPHSRRPVPKVPEMHPDEQPERRLEYTRERLLEFKKELQTKQDGHGEESGGGFGGFGGFGGGGGETGKQGGQSKPGTQTRDRSISSVSIHSGGRPKSSLSGPTDKGTPEPPLEEVPEEPSPLELQIQQEEQIKLQYEQDVLIDNIQGVMKKFDADLRTLRHDKQHLDVALKCADLRQVTLFEEYMLLKEFEKRENIYATKVNTKLTEKEEMQDKVEDCQMKLEAKKQDIEKLLDQEKALYTTFSTAMGENNKFENFLTKVFKKKIKRAKKKAQTEEGSDEESDEEDSDEDLSSSDEEDSDAEELDDTVCPPGCDQALFDQVCQLRENRLDLEEELADEKKASETLKKEYDALVKKAKVIDSALNTAEADLEAFQREKQQKLNELDVVVVLRLSQIQYMVNSAIPQDLSPCLVFCGSGLNQLQHRIKELEKEKHEQKRLYREHRHKHVQLIRDKKVMESKIAELDEKVENMMMLKFGRLVDLEKLETVSVNRTVEELKEKLRQQEVKAANDVAKWDTKIDSYKSKVTQLTRENTQRLDTFTVLLEEKKELEQMLDSRQKTLGTEFTGARKADVRERQRLIQLVQLQAQEIDALKDEITLLSRKGGHILPPAQPPLPPGQTPIPNT